MITNTARNDSAGRFRGYGQPGSPPTGAGGAAALGSLLIALGLMCFGTARSQAGTVLGPWVPMFKGINHAVGTNTAGGGGFPELQVVYFLRVDLTDPDIRLFASPRRTNWVANGTETYGYTMTNFLKNHGLQVAINANQFSPSSYFQAEGIACNINGMVFSQGQMVSPAVTSGTSDAATLCFTSNNIPTYYPTNVPPASTNGVHTAVSGYYNILYNGVNVGSNYIGNPEVAHQLQPRTAIGLSQDRRYVFLLAIDGRQGSLEYSQGAYDWETAEWLKLAGAWDAANMDGGGSTCIVVMDSTGTPVPLNHDSASLTAPGFRERTVGAHFGIYAAPLPGFFNDFKVFPDDTTATITWTTTNPATTQLKYGTNLNLTSLSVSNSVRQTNHTGLLTNLEPDTRYYFAALASTGSTNYVSSNYAFTTVNYVTPLSVLQLASIWQYTTQNLNGVNWKARTYNDSGWIGSGEGLLWTDPRGVNSAIPVPLNTEMPGVAGTGNPYTTYYFRSHFNFTNNPAGVSLQIEAYVDDGAVFYLNGTELQRVRMPPPPTVISNATVASTAPCAGDATCADSIVLSGPIIATNLVAGDNVLAVEVHNRGGGSLDVTFGLDAWLVVPYNLRPALSVTSFNGTITLSWGQGGYTLQQASAPAGVWTDVPGPVITSPFTTNSPAGNLFFRLRK